MTDKQLITRVFKEFFKLNSKTVTFSFIWISFFLWAISILEPLFVEKVISMIEDFTKTWVFDFSWFYLVLVFWFLFIFIVAFIRFFHDYFIEKRILKSYNNLFIEKSDLAIKMTYWEFLSQKKWELYKKFNRWVEDYFWFLSLIFTSIFESLWLVIFAVIISFIIDWRLALATLAILPIYFFMVFYYNNNTRKKQDSLNRDWDIAFNQLSDNVSNISLVKTLNLHSKILDKIKNLLSNALWKQLYVTKRWSFAEVQLSVFVWLSRFLVILVWVYLFIDWYITLSYIFLFFAIVNYIYFPLNFIFQNLKTIQKYIAWIKSFFELVDKLEVEEFDDSKKSLESIKWYMEFKNVWFSYNEDKKVFDDLSFEIKSWEKVAFVWNTWAGKSSIVNLIFRFWDIDSWNIYIDWIDIKEVCKVSLRKHIWIVLQDNSLFNTSLIENLRFAKPEASQEEIEEALKKAQADFVFDLKDWLDTMIWERWLKLSGWEKQRINIARLFLKNPEILVLDEATSALDNKTEKLVQKALDELMKWRTSIVIAHRLSTIKNSDKIFMLDAWKIVEEWKYDELMDKKSKFYELANPSHLIIN